MLHLEHNRPLKQLTTFKIGGPARAFVEITDPGDLPEAFRHGEALRTNGGLPPLILGGGSNMLVSDAGYNGLVIQIANKGITLSGIGYRVSGIEGSSKPSGNPKPETRNPALRIASGEIWDDVVKFAVEHGLWGIENLSRIPGRAGAVPVQNVGAYGQEIQNVLVNV
ncbi:MAG TPA: FAD-binding protein, partial [Candidatus Kapabacteria bacterium]|nr:FAD-binding protein [Candidatus Kapabacteria bacterium]